MYPENNQKHCEIFNSNADSNNDKDENMNNKDMEITIEENSILINCTAQNKGENKIKKKNKDITREDEKNNKNSNLEKGCQIFCEALDSKILKGELPNLS